MRAGILALTPHRCPEECITPVATSAPWLHFATTRRSLASQASGAVSRALSSCISEPLVILQPPGMLATYAPRIHQNMKAKLGELFRRHPSLQLNFSNSVYPATSFNFGPSTVCFAHTDAANDACNCCHITALGDYDPNLGGHLVLYDLKLIVRFPPGSSVLIPSAIMRHGNIPIRTHETRMSLTQYCAGGLLRWVECGFRTVSGLAAEDPQGSAAFRAALTKRVQKCIQRFSTVQSLLHDLAEVA